MVTLLLSRVIVNHLDDFFGIFKKDQKVESLSKKFDKICSNIHMVINDKKK